MKYKDLELNKEEILAQAGGEPNVAQIIADLEYRLERTA
jgi:hypothetical protein